MIPKEWLDDARAQRIVVHWTAGKRLCSSLERDHYHFLVEDGGRVIKGTRPPKDNDSTKDGIYIAHTRGLNTGSIGVAFCGMFSATPKTPGPECITVIQVVKMIELLADLCIHYGLNPKDKKHVLGHSEVEEVYGVAQAAKWDPDWLPQTGYQHPGSMDWLRMRVAEAIERRQKAASPAPEIRAEEEKEVKVPNLPTPKQLAVKEKEMGKAISNLGGRKFVLSVLGVGAIVLNERFGLNITPEMMDNITNLILVFVMGEGAGDIVGRFRKPA